MDKELLKQFYQQEHMRVEVYKFFKKVLDDIALERVYKGESTEGIKDAKQVLIRAEAELQTMFFSKPKVKDEQRAL